MHPICYHIFFFPPNVYNQNFENLTDPYFRPNFPNSSALDATSHTSNALDPCSVSDSQTLSISVQPRMGGFNLNESLNVDVGEKHQIWTLEDDQMLMKAWSTISTNFAVENAQREANFWERIRDYFNMHKKIRS